MKRILCMMFALLLFAGCSNADDTKPEMDSLATNENAEAIAEDDTEPASDAEVPSYDSEGQTIPMETEAASELQQEDMPSETGAAAEPVSPIETEAASSAEEQQTVTTTAGSAEGLPGIDGITDAQWLALGQELYMNGCETAFRYLCTGSEFPFDRENLEIIDKTYFLTTCASFEEATAGYYELFSSEYHGSDFDDILLVQDGRVYAVRGARGMDMTYLSSEVDSIVSVAEEEIRFRVIIQYQDSETEADFTLVPENGVWKICEFTLPY